MCAMNNIDPDTRVYTDEENIGKDVVIGPYSVIDADEIGDNTVIGSNTVINEGVVIGKNCRIGNHVNLGFLAQGLYDDLEPGKLIIKDNVKIESKVTLERATEEGNSTTIGDNSVLYAGVHIGHDSEIGEGVSVISGALLAGNVKVGNYAVISTSMIHQFTRIGDVSIIAGNTRITKDVLPYICVAESRKKERNMVFFINQVGLQRAGYTAEQMTNIQKAYHILFRTPTIQKGLENLVKETDNNEARKIAEFVGQSLKGRGFYSFPYMKANLRIFNPTSVYANKGDYDSNKGR